MKKSVSITEWLIWGGLALVIAVITGAFAWNRLHKLDLPPLHTVTHFSLTNQVGQVITRSNLLGQVWVADIIFSRCPVQCLRMSKSMQKLHEALPPGKKITLVSLTADPTYDTPAILKQYGERFGANTGNWHFLTGPKEDIVGLALGGLLLAVEEKPPETREEINDLFIHSTRFIVVDKKGHIRAHFDGEDPVTQPQILKVLNALARE